jgi:hypothetical protein
MANVLDAASGLPLGSASTTALLEWQGVKVGLIGGRAGRVGGSNQTAVLALESCWQLSPPRHSITHWVNVSSSQSEEVACTGTHGHSAKSMPS